MEIFKIQLPLIGEELALVYNKDRSVQDMVPISGEILSFMGRSNKKYALASLENGEFKIEKESEWQAW